MPRKVYCIRCHNVFEAPRGNVCPECLSKIKKGRDNDRLSPSKRGYDNTWNKFRRSFLYDHPFCAVCLVIHDRLTPATEIHHITTIRDDPTLRLDEENLVPLCHECHSRETWERREYNDEEIDMHEIRKQALLKEENFGLTPFSNIPSRSS